MCGIMGFVRTGRNTALTKQVITSVFKFIASRGTDASGWGMLLPSGPKMEKAPQPSYKIARWKNYRRNIGRVNLMVGHARATTSGTHKVNRNNHPHCSRRLANILVHNGFIYDRDQRDYHLTSQCDSEVLLRMIEKHGIREACQEMVPFFSSMYAWLNLVPEKELIYAYKDDDMPCVYLDLTKEIGGILLASTDTILDAALKDAGLSYPGLYRQVVDLKPYHLYEFHLGKNNPKVKKIGNSYGPRSYCGSHYRRPYEVMKGYSPVKKDPELRSSYIKLPSGIWLPVEYATSDELHSACEYRFGPSGATTGDEYYDQQKEIDARRKHARLRMLVETTEEMDQLKEYYGIEGEDEV